MSESFNSLIVTSRSKPIITMLEEIRAYITRRWAKNRLKISTHEGSVCPRILARFKEEPANSPHWLPRYFNNHFFTIMLFLSIQIHPFLI